MADLQSQLQSAKTNNVSGLHDDIEDLHTQLQLQQDASSKLTETNQSLKKELMVLQTALEEKKERISSVMAEKSELGQQVLGLRSEKERERKLRQDLDAKNQELSRLNHDQEDEVSSLMMKLSEANDESQRAKRAHNRVRRTHSSQVVG